MSSYLDYNSPEQNVRYYPNGQNYYVLNPLSREFFGNLLKFEEKINSRSYNLETLNEIISIYAVKTLFLIIFSYFFDF